MFFFFGLYIQILQRQLPQLPKSKPRLSKLPYLNRSNITSLRHRVDLMETLSKKNCSDILEMRKSLKEFDERLKRLESIQNV